MPTSLIARLADRPQFPPPDPTDRLRDARAPSGYHGVERHGLRFRGRIPLLKSPFPSRPTAREAAADLVAFWEGHFGRRWPEFFAARHCPAWRAEGLPDGRWGLVVYVRGFEWRPTRKAFGAEPEVGEWYAKWARRRYKRAAWKSLRQA